MKYRRPIGGKNKESRHTLRKGNGGVTLYTHTKPEKHSTNKHKSTSH